MEWTVGELSRRSGTSISAIHFYERKGLNASRRTTGNQRRYEKDVLRRISIIRIAQDVASRSRRSRAISAVCPKEATPQGGTGNAYPNSGPMISTAESPLCRNCG